VTSTGFGGRDEVRSNVGRVGEHDDVTTPGLQFVRAPDAVWRSIPEMLAVTVGAAAPLRITGSAALVWQHLEHPTTAQALVAALEQQVGTSSARLDEDVRRLLDDLVEHGLVTAR
jgi:hypothetical protein